MWQILMLQKPKQISHIHINRDFSIFYLKRIMQKFDKKAPAFRRDNFKLILCYTLESRRHKIKLRPNDSMLTIFIYENCLSNSVSSSSKFSGSQNEQSLSSILGEISELFGLLPSFVLCLGFCSEFMAQAKPICLSRLSHLSDS
jgi:hypothetical protein